MEAKRGAARLKIFPHRLSQHRATRAKTFGFPSCIAFSISSYPIGKVWQKRYHQLDIELLHEQVESLKFPCPQGPPKRYMHFIPRGVRSMLSYGAENPGELS